VLSLANTPSSAFYFVSLKDWASARSPRSRSTPSWLTWGRGWPASPGSRVPVPAARGPGIGMAGGATFLLQDRAGKDVKFWREHGQVPGGGAEAARVRPGRTTFQPAVPQLFVKVDRDKVLRRAGHLRSVPDAPDFMAATSSTTSTASGAVQVYVQADAEARSRVEDIGQLYVHTGRATGPLSTLVSVESRPGPDFTCASTSTARPRSTQSPCRGQLRAGHASPGGGVPSDHAAEMGFDYMGMSFQEKKAQEGVSSW